ncbi:MATE family efflux transporter [Anaerotignum sp.]|uniref:MATE family efflux transporter n=1 Tax=Anaerotignum sp. TaxID=2039241 RepID=UPI002714C0EB|nr:MATE family efflux transporter [Anaerotignum sp.]
MRIQLSNHFTYRRLLRFVISPILMMICTSLYSIVDGFFVSNFVGKTPFAAVNLIMPIAMGVGTIGFMIGTGGSAVISKTLGEGKHEQANQYFSMLIYIAVALSLVVSVIGFIFIKPISSSLGATGELLENCIIYGRIIFFSMTAFILQNIFQNFFITAEKPVLSLKISIMAGITNAVLDFLFMAVFHWGIAGAALATALGQLVGGIVPIIYFSKKNDSLLQLTKTKFYGKILLKTCTNGSSEMVTNLSSSFVSIIYNFQLMKIAGENGIAAYGIIMYVNFIFMAIFIGFSIGTAPIIGYHYGAANHDELKSLFRKSIKLIAVSGVVLTLLAEVFAAPLVKIFASYDIELFTMTCHGFRLYSIAFMLMGINVWGSAFFTALNNGIVSATISFLRTLVFQIIVILILPIFFGINGIWLAIVVSELLALFITIIFLIKNKTKYLYA